MNAADHLAAAEAHIADAEAAADQTMPYSVPVSAWLAVAHTLAALAIEAGVPVTQTAVPNG